MTLDELKELQPALSSAMLTAMSETAVKLVHSQMMSGYAHPVYKTGALLADVQISKVDDRRVLIGNTLPYAPPVHNGTGHAEARPYLADAMANGEALQAAAVEALYGCL